MYECLYVWTLQMQMRWEGGESYSMAYGDEEPADGGGFERG